MHLGYTTRAEFTEATGFPPKTLGDLEKCRRDSFSRETLARLEKALDWPEGYIDEILHAAGADDPFAILGRLYRVVDGQRVLPAPEEYPEGSPERRVLSAVARFQAAPVVMVTDSGVGKTELLRRLMAQPFGSGGTSVPAAVRQLLALVGPDSPLPEADRLHLLTTVAAVIVPYLEKAAAVRDLTPFWDVAEGGDPVVLPRRPSSVRRDEEAPSRKG